MVVDRNWNVFPCKQVPFLRYIHLNIEKFKRMNIIALKRITAFSSLGVVVCTFKMFLAIHFHSFIDVPVSSQYKISTMPKK